jgi:hypothetical protein
MAIPGLVALMTLIGNACARGRIHGKYFARLATFTVALSVSTQKGEKSGLSKCFQLLFKA